MKKVFLLILCGLFFQYTNTRADVVSIVDMGSYRPQHKNMSPSETVAPGLPDPRDEQAVRKYFKERIENAAVTQVSIDEDYTSPTSVNVVHTPEYLKALEEEKKPLFQKMYEEAVQALNDDSDNPRPSDVATEEEQNAATSATRFFTLDTPRRPRIEDDFANEPEIPTVGFTLPSGRRMLAPAIEHIPYFLSYIDIQANGFLKIEETIIVVADNNKFTQAIRRVFPKYAYNDKGQSQRIELILNNVSINDTPVEYTTEEIGNDIILKPKYKQNIEPGVYTYTFNYMVNYQLWQKNNFVVMNWPITGRPLNAFITSANAIITLPNGQTFKNVQGIVGEHTHTTNRRTNIIPMADNVVALSNYTPLLNGESMNIIAIAETSAFLPNLYKGFNTFLHNWGSVMYAFLGFLAIFLSYLLSLVSLKKERRKSKYTPSYNGSLMRHILVGKYDRIAFVAQILDLYRKQALNIVSENNRLFLNRQNITGSRLSKTDKKALRKLFAHKAKQIEVNTFHNKIFKYIAKIYEKTNNKQIKKYRLLHNISYIIFSTIMLLLTMIFIALISVNTAQMLIILATTVALYAFYIWIFRRRFKRWYINILVKLFCVTAIFAIWIFSSVYIGGTTNFIILLMVITIFAFTRIFGEQNNFINEAKSAIGNYKEYLQTNADALNLSRDFLNLQSNIFALDITEYFPQNMANKSFYKLDIAEQLRQALVGIL